MSKARRKVWMKEVTRRLSGGEVNVKRYTFSDSSVQTNVPDCGNPGLGIMGRVNSDLEVGGNVDMVGVRFV